jgi:hypothetical protein
VARKKVLKSPATYRISCIVRRAPVVAVNDEHAIMHDLDEEHEGRELSFADAMKRHLRQFH